MSLFDNPEYRWRETYQLFHKKSRRPTVEDVQKLLGNARENYRLEDLRGDESSRFESVTVLAADAFAAIDITYVADDQIQEQVGEIQEEMKEVLEDLEDLAKLDSLTDYDVCLDLLHFERLVDMVAQEDDELSAFFDPGALLSVIEKLTSLTGGVCLDPASATIM
jgi:hypothetical protein